MKSWLTRFATLTLLPSLIGCLPPVQETTDSTPPVVTEEAQASASAPHDESPVTPASATTSAEGFTTTKSGLKYKIVRPGSNKKPTAADTVSCHYKGWLDNGKEFDSSYSRGEPTEFPLGGVIGGWTEGLQLIGEGGEIELEIPSQLGYGDRGAPPDIPGGATLHFKVELLRVL